jgi:hypothetical protein
MSANASLQRAPDEADLLGLCEPPDVLLIPSAGTAYVTNVA